VYWKADPKTTLLSPQGGLTPFGCELTFEMARLFYALRKGYKTIETCNIPVAKHDKDLMKVMSVSLVVIWRKCRNEKSGVHTKLNTMGLQFNMK
jgi:hypothetical protein